MEISMDMILTGLRLSAVRQAVILQCLEAYGWGNANPEEEYVQHSEQVTRIKAVVDIYGPADLTTEYARNHPLVTAFIAQVI